MPRLDNTDDTVRENFDLVVDPDDPGQTDPVDVCYLCHCAWLDANLEIEHPDYDDDVYHCAECKKRLTNKDN